MKKLLSIFAVVAFAYTANAGTLDDVKNRGFLKCGVTTGLIGFAAPDDAGKLLVHALSPAHHQHGAPGLFRRGGPRRRCLQHQ